MNASTARIGHHRRLVFVGLGASVAVHAAVFAGLSFSVPNVPNGDVESAPPRPSIAADEVPLQVVQIQETLPVDPEVAVTDVPVLTSPAPVEEPGTAAPSRAAASASAAETKAMTLDDLQKAIVFTSRELSMRPNFAASRQIAGARDPIAAVDPHAGHDHGDLDDDEDGFWTRLGNAWGQAMSGSGGGKICRPPVVIR